MLFQRIRVLLWLSVHGVALELGDPARRWDLQQSARRISKTNRSRLLRIGGKTMSHLDTYTPVKWQALRLFLIRAQFKTSTPITLKRKRSYSRVKTIWIPALIIALAVLSVVGR